METNRPVEPEFPQEYEDRNETARPGSLRLFLLVGLLAMVGFAMYRATVGPGAGASFGPGIGQDASFQWDVVDLQGQPLDLSQYRGQTVFLNVWATWCPPCRSEFPSIVRLSNDPKVRDVTFLCISVDDSIDPVRTFADRQGGDRINYLVANGPAPPVLSTQGIPATFFIAPDGTIAHSAIGAEDWDRPEFVDQLASLSRSAANVDK